MRGEQKGRHVESVVQSHDRISRDGPAVKTSLREEINIIYFKPHYQHVLWRAVQVGMWVNHSNPPRNITTTGWIAILNSQYMFP